MRCSPEIRSRIRAARRLQTGSSVPGVLEPGAGRSQGARPARHARPHRRGGLAQRGRALGIQVVAGDGPLAAEAKAVVWGEPPNAHGVNWHLTNGALIETEAEVVDIDNTAAAYCGVRVTMLTSPFASALAQTMVPFGRGTISSPPVKAYGASRGARGWQTAPSRSTTMEK